MDNTLKTGDAKSSNEKRRGNAAIEFALGSTLLFLLLGGVSDFARLFYYASIVSNSARAGVQRGMYDVESGVTNTTTISSDMQTSAQDEPGTSGMTGLTAITSVYCQCEGSSSNVGCATTCSGSAPNMFAKVTAQYPFTTVISWPSIPSSVAISQTAIVRVQ
jgi:Flp pilus assembly protein TadG